MYLYNTTSENIRIRTQLKVSEERPYMLNTFFCETMLYEQLGKIISQEEKLILDNVNIDANSDVILIANPYSAR